MFKRPNFIIFFLLLSLSSCIFEADETGDNRAQPDLGRKKPKKETKPITTLSTSYSGISKAIRIQIFHDKNNSPISYDEFSSILKNANSNRFYTLPSIFYRTPRREKHNDGVKIGTIETLKARSGECGNTDSLKTIKDKIDNCRKIYKEKSVWNGRALGTQGEGKWELVIRLEDSSSIGHEIWQDEITKLLWSSTVAEVPYDDAIGNTNDYCKGHENNFKLGNFSSSKVLWRLPTRNDWLQADLNGARFVLLTKDSSEDWKNLVYWTATYSSEDNTQAWTYRLHDGMLALKPLGGDDSFKQKVRCVGHIIKK